MITSTFNDSLLRSFGKFSTDEFPNSWVESFFRTDPTISSIFPPYNIKKIDSSNFKIEVVAAGFSIDEFDIELDEDTLKIVCTPKKQESYVFLYRGLTYKSWHKNFVLAEGVKVTRVALENGLLIIDLEKTSTLKNKPLKLNIEAPSAKKHPQILNEQSSI